MDPLGDVSGGDVSGWPEGGRDRLHGHPDLDALGRRLRLEMDETLRAEQYAARVSAQRRSTIRDRFLLAEDRAESLNVEVVDGSDIHGTIAAVGADHIVVVHHGRHCWVALQHVVAVRRPTP
ncbi:MAG: DUF2642 domain-containing protein [bacterium]|nr:DUF2642 domain-containing protein [bacterium]